VRALWRGAVWAIIVPARLDRARPAPPRPAGLEALTIRILRKILLACLWAFCGAIAGALTLYVLHARGMPDLKPWHEYELERDFRAADAGETFEAYLAREERVFRSLAEQVDRNRRAETTYNRFVAESPVDPAGFDPNWNRSFVLDTAQPRGAALLLHGLSDSPYSLRAVGEHLHARGFYVVGLRIPGHGTAPSALAQARWNDWREAVRVAAHHVAARSGDGPFAIVGYSNGAALATDYTLGALENDEEPVPARLVLFSAALGVSKTAALAHFQRELARVPGLEKLGWTDILPEYDPYKYNSFPIEAGEQIYDLTTQLQRRLAERAQAGTLAAFPPVLAFQSAVDATIPADSVMVYLLDHLPKNGSHARGAAEPPAESAAQSVRCHHPDEREDHERGGGGETPGRGQRRLERHRHEVEMAHGHLLAFPRGPAVPPG